MADDPANHERGPALAGKRDTALDERKFGIPALLELSVRLAAYDGTDLSVDGTIHKLHQGWGVYEPDAVARGCGQDSYPAGGQTTGRPKQTEGCGKSKASSIRMKKSPLHGR